MRISPFLILLALTAAPCLARDPAQAAPALELPRTSVAARVGGEPISDGAVDALHALARMRQPEAARETTLQGMIDDRLLASDARRRFTPTALFPEARVGFAPDISAERRLLSLLQSLYGNHWTSSDAVTAADAVDAAIVDCVPPGAKALEQALGAKAALRITDELSSEQQAAAAQLIVARFRLPAVQGIEALSMLELYRRQNAQGRLALHAYDLEFLRVQARQYVGNRLLLDRASRILGAPFVAELRERLADQEYVRALAHWYGVGVDAHQETAHLIKLAHTVSQADIQTYYAANKDEFLRLDRVKARHIRLRNESAASTVYASLSAKSAQFADLARTHSIAGDAASGGDLGWISRERSADWLSDLAFSQKPDVVGRPTRTPGSAQNDAAETDAAWEIVLVEQQAHSYYPANSETVSWAARRAIAQGRAQDEFRALRHALRQQVKIELAATATSPSSAGSPP